MATLQNTMTKKHIILNVNHSFGRDTVTNITSLQSPESSRNHATITWDGEAWQLKDISTNGTQINAERVISGVYHKLNIKNLIQFGPAQDDIWQVIELSAPVTGLVPITDGLPFILLHDVVVLPTEPIDMLVYLSENGEWICEENNASFTLHPGDKVGCEQKFWQFVEGRPCTTTAIGELSPPPNDIKFRFNASQNEEHVSLSLIVDNKDIDLGERNHHYLLLLLARQRLDDIKKDLPPAEQGWIDKDILVKMTGIIEQHINIQIYRFRKQVATIMPHSTTLHQVIQRRPGELRFAYSDINIEGGFLIAKSM